MSKSNKENSATNQYFSESERLEQLGLLFYLVFKTEFDYGRLIHPNLLKLFNSEYRERVLEIKSKTTLSEDYLHQVFESVRSIPFSDIDGNFTWNHVKKDFTARTHQELIRAAIKNPELQELITIFHIAKNSFLQLRKQLRSGYTSI
ncbi:MAG: hypothetical protein UR52_C0023G0003 [Candidatus Gottesmanbacteria bacterium GW2011_GWA1_34_13]|uniref:Uncharacterized protein n=1 Tax=Candidatus Gottesmanbacteria bacterium GW2011_GWA1_34_13 TaxID=1618434 RepID=A0A0G0AM36_9BACT|nr:MAG: hypothetical protein UR52_C0023G0003 [Candidatus Gottesmanbacteria bacterium GW2011_GWA1_34_13]KKQ76187.1 MAG: hypothetical protein US98_C0046G0002 [Parcubacteria group bacterium GW2011_GWC1_38_6]